MVSYPVCAAIALIVAILVLVLVAVLKSGAVADASSAGARGEKEQWTKHLGQAVATAPRRSYKDAPEPAGNPAKWGAWIHGLLRYHASLIDQVEPTSGAMVRQDGKTYGVVKDPEQKYIVLPIAQLERMDPRWQYRTMRLLGEAEQTLKLDMMNRGYRVALVGEGGRTTKDPYLVVEEPKAEPAAASA